MKSKVRKYHNEQRERSRKMEDAKRLQAAVKAAGLPGVPTPAQELAALDAYIRRLEIIQSELESEFGKRDELSWVKLEISHAIEHITRLRIQEVKPEKISFVR